MHALDAWCRDLFLCGPPELLARVRSQIRSSDVETNATRDVVCCRKSVDSCLQTLHRPKQLIQAENEVVSERTVLIIPGEITATVDLVFVSFVKPSTLVVIMFLHHMGNDVGTRCVDSERDVAMFNCSRRNELSFFMTLQKDGPRKRLIYIEEACIASYVSCPHHR